MDFEADAGGGLAAIADLHGSSAIDRGGVQGTNLSMLSIERVLAGECADAGDSRGRCHAIGKGARDAVDEYAPTNRARAGVERSVVADVRDGPAARRLFFNGIRGRTGGRRGSDLDLTG